MVYKYIFLKELFHIYIYIYVSHADSILRALERIMN